MYFYHRKRPGKAAATTAASAFTACTFKDKKAAATANCTLPHQALLSSQGNCTSSAAQILAKYIPDLQAKIIEKTNAHRVIIKKILA